MESNQTMNQTVSLQNECDEDNDCLFVAGDGFFRVWHVILIVAIIALAISECTVRPYHT